VAACADSVETRTENRSLWSESSTHKGNHTLPRLKNISRCARRKGRDGTPYRESRGVGQASSRRPERGKELGGSEYLNARPGKPFFKITSFCFHKNEAEKVG
jgi:hypothetical protein